MGEPLKKRILVAEGNALATTEIMRGLGAPSYGESYARLLQSMSDRVECDVVYPSEDGPECLPENAVFADYQGIVFTGSALSCYQEIPEVQNQITMAKNAFDSGIPVFGSCWGLQIMCVALGGTVTKNPRGREIGIARAIRPNDDGVAHPMYRGKPAPFEALSVHMDEVSTLPADAQLLAGNDMTQVQAITIERGGSSFWGVQYHPEFDFATMAVVYRRLKQPLIRESLFNDEQAVEQCAEAFEQNTLEGLTPAVSEPKLRHLEIFNWLQTMVLCH